METVLTQPIKQFLELATIFWRQSRAINNLDNSNSEVKRLEREVDRLGRVLKTCEIEINDYEGRKNNNLNVDTISIEVSENVIEEIIFETVKPEIRYKGEVQQRSSVVVHKPAVESDGEAAPPVKPTLAESEAATAMSVPEPEQQASPQPDENVPEPDEATVGVIPNRDEKRTRKAGAAAFAWLIVLSCVIVVIVVFALSSNAAAENEIINNELKVIIDEKNTIIDFQNTRITDLEGQVTMMEGSAAEEHPLIDPVIEDAVSDVIELVRYTIMPGDTLYSIIEENGLDIAENENIIRNINGITNPNRIIAGQDIYLPLR